MTMLLLLGACQDQVDVKGDPNETSDETPTDTSTPGTSTKGASPSCGDQAWHEVSFDTEDGITLHADWRPGPASDSPALILFHMIPPNWDRTTYPESVRNTLAGLGFGLLNVDRRGAGESGGTAKDAYEGPGGRLDMQAAVAFVTSKESGCAADPNGLHLVGASNGTTAVLDYAVDRDAGLPLPASVIFLSPGTYTENQVVLDTDRVGWSDALSQPFLWVFPDAEPYTTRFYKDYPGAWRFREVQGSDQHGTHMFDGGVVEDEVVDWMTAFLDDPSSMKDITP